MVFYEDHAYLHLVPVLRHVAVPLLSLLSQRLRNVVEY